VGSLLGLDLLLSEHAVNGDWSNSVAAQLKFSLTPEHPVFCGVRGRERLAVIDGRLAGDQQSGL
jgi:hypothetical protein